MTNWPAAIGFAAFSYLMAVSIAVAVLSSRGLIRLPGPLAGLLNEYVGATPMRFAKIVAAGIGSLLIGTILVLMMVVWSR